MARHVSLARQPQVPGVGRWAAAFSRGFYVGHGPASSRVLEGSPVTALGWSGRNRVLAVLVPSPGPGLMTYDPAAEQLDVVEGWPPTEFAADSEDSLVVGAGGQLLWSSSDGSIPAALEGMTGPLGQMTVAGERAPVVADDRLQVRLNRGWHDIGGAAPQTRLASTVQTLVIAGKDGAVRGLAWSEEARRHKYPSIRQTFVFPPFPRDPSSSPQEQSTVEGDPVDQLATAADLTVAASADRVAVLSGDAVVARWETTYRLLKAVLPPEDLARARLLLALATGRPDLGEHLLDQVAEAPLRDTLGSVVDGWPPAEREWLTENIPAGVVWRGITCRELAPAAVHVRRFVFRASVDADAKPPVGGANQDLIVATQAGFPRRLSVVAAHQWGERPGDAAALERRLAARHEVVAAATLLGSNCNLQRPADTVGASTRLPSRWRESLSMVPQGLSLSNAQTAPVG